MPVEPQLQSQICIATHTTQIPYYLFESNVKINVATVNLAIVNLAINLPKMAGIGGKFCNFC